MALQAVIKAVIKANHLSGKFAEPVTFTAAATGSTPRTVWMSITPDRRNEQDNVTDDQTERVECLFLTDPADPDRGGIAELFLNDSFSRSSTYDPDSTPFHHTGEILERAQHSMKAAFERGKRVAQGPGN